MRAIGVHINRGAMQQAELESVYDMLSIQVAGSELLDKYHKKEVNSWTRF
jgi:hypothetical protein